MNLNALQKIGAAQNGTKTDQIERNPEVTALLRDRLRSWEEAHPKTPPTECGTPLTDEELEQLQSIGYLGEDDGL